MIREAIDKVMESTLHKYDNNTKEELLLLLKHHEEDLAEYKERGDDTTEIEHDIKEIKKALEGKQDD